MELTLAVDFGSTFTKVAALDLKNEQLVGIAKAPSTVDTNVMVGLQDAIRSLQEKIGNNELNIKQVFSCSSAAGGLRMVVAGLVNELTTKAAREAALGAGAKVIGTYSYGLSLDDLKDIELIAPDLILLTGGTDGGNTKVMLHNASAIGASSLDVPIILAGNKMAAEAAQSILKNAGKYVVSVENVLPELDRLNIEPARASIREIFMERIIRAKGIDKAQEFVGRTILPTPMAILKGAALLSHGSGDEEGLGELMVIDIGGATTDVFSVAYGHPSSPGVIFKGLPEPYEKRTVEGDLGLRYNALTILDTAGKEKIIHKIETVGGYSIQIKKLEEAVHNLSARVNTVPASKEDFLIDVGLASSAAEIAAGRHAGKIEEIYYPTGKVIVQYGKNLTGIKHIIGTGGIFASGKEPRRILESACFDEKTPDSLRPMNPNFYVDECYILYAVGLLAEEYPSTVLKIIKKHLRKV
ncbi:MAG: MutL protein [Firmicutes bacterium]|nr:MutL protein [Bacillota bacterium]